MTLWMIAYQSRSLIPDQKLHLELQKIARISSEENRRFGISGVLFHQKDRFFQILEGDEDVVKTLIRNIEDDYRHDRVARRVDKEINQRSFADWSMATFELDDLSVQGNLNYAFLAETYRNILRDKERLDSEFVAFARSSMRVFEHHLVAA